MGVHASTERNDRPGGSNGPPREDRLRTSLLIGSALYAVLLSILYGLERDAWAALTLWPAWFWGAFGLLVALLAFARKERLSRVVIGLWVLFFVVFCEEARYPLRAWRHWPDAEWKTARSAGRALRVVSINCCGGQTAAVEQARAYSPDILLLQESPSSNEVEQLAKEFFGDQAGWVYGGDTAVIARGVCRPVKVDPKLVLPFTWARVQLSTGIELEVISVHLLPPMLRHDLWSLDCWQGTAHLERARRDQVRRLVRYLSRVPSATKVVVGGDFNLPATDGVLRLFRGPPTDSFTSRGIGWGNTVLNEFPISRFDQVWLSEGLQPAGTLAVRSKTSDHRIVICDLIVNDARRRR